MIVVRLIAGRPDGQLDNLVIAHIVAVFLIIAVAVDEIELVVFVIEIPDFVLIVVVEAAFRANPQTVIAADNIVKATAGACLTHSSVCFFPSPYNVILNIVLHFLLCPIVYYC